MNSPDRGITGKGVSPDSGKQEVPSRSLFGGGREIRIRHNGETYTLRITSNDKLILTK